MAKTQPAPLAPAVPFKRVPFNNLWITHDKLDLKAIYRRPRYAIDRYGEPQREFDPATGVPAWDITTALPVRHHNKWIARGFQYVTLGTMDDLRAAASQGTLTTPDGRSQAPPSDYINHRVGGPWNAVLYLEKAGAEDLEAFQVLSENVRRFGSDAVLAIRQQSDPLFELPPTLQGIPAGGK